MFASGTGPDIELRGNPWQTLRMPGRSLDNPIKPGPHHPSSAARGAAQGNTEPRASLILALGRTPSQPVRSILQRCRGVQDLVKLGQFEHRHDLCPGPRDAQVASTSRVIFNPEISAPRPVESMKSVPARSTTTRVRCSRSTIRVISSRKRGAATIQLPVEADDGSVSAGWFNLKLHFPQLLQCWWNRRGSRTGPLRTMITAGMAGSGVPREILGKPVERRKKLRKSRATRGSLMQEVPLMSPAGAGIELAAWAPLTIPWPLYLSPIAAAFNA